MIRQHVGKLASRALSLVRFWSKPTSIRTRCVVLHDEAVLLVRNTFGRQLWTLPGGDIKRDETAERSAARELGEELSVSPRRLRYIGEVKEETSHMVVDARVFEASVENRDFRAARFELIDARWFPIDDLPENPSPAVPAALELRRIGGAEGR